MFCYENKWPTWYPSPVICSICICGYVVSHSPIATTTSTSTSSTTTESTSITSTVATTTVASGIDRPITIHVGRRIAAAAVIVATAAALGLINWNNTIFEKSDGIASTPFNELPIPVEGLDFINFGSCDDELILFGADGICYPVLKRGPCPASINGWTESLSDATVFVTKKKIRSTAAEDRDFITRRTAIRSATVHQMHFLFQFLVHT